MNRFFRKKLFGGYSLVEVVLAIALGAVVLSSLTMCFIVSRRQWKKAKYQSVLMQHLRVSLDRISSELRYADSLTSAATDVLTFTTTNMLNDTPDTETITYSRQPMDDVLLRAVNFGMGYAIAGTGLEPTSEPIHVSIFTNVPYKLVGSTLVPLSGPDSLSIAVAVKVTVDVFGTEGEFLSGSTLVKMRNKT